MPVAARSSQEAPPAFSPIGAPARPTRRSEGRSLAQWITRISQNIEHFPFVQPSRTKKDYLLSMTDFIATPMRLDPVHPDREELQPMRLCAGSLPQRSVSTSVVGNAGVEPAATQGYGAS